MLVLSLDPATTTEQRSVVVAACGRVGAALQETVDVVVEDQLGALRSTVRDIPPFYARRADNGTPRH